jgi:hypothetical protein
VSKRSHNRHVTRQRTEKYYAKVHPPHMTLCKTPGSKKSKRSGTSSSTHVHHLYTSRSLGGRTSLRQEVLNASAIHKRQAKDRIDYALRRDAMSTAERDELNAICTNTTNDNTTNDTSDLEHNAWEMDVDAVLAGTETIDISHAGGEFSSVMDIADDLLGTVNR